MKGLEISQLLTRKQVAIDETFATSFNFTHLHATLAQLCPTTDLILHAFSTTAKQKRTATEQSVSRKAKVR